MDQKRMKIDIATEDKVHRPLNRIWMTILYGIGVSFSIIQIYIAIFNPLDAWTHKSLVLWFTGILVAMTTKANLRFKLLSYTSDILITAGIIASGAYLIINRFDIVYRVGIDPTILDVIFGAIMIVGSLELTRRTVGFGMVVVCVVFLLYPWFGKYIPGPLGHDGYNFARVISAIYSDLGVYGSPLSVAASTVFYFILFGAFLLKFGGGQFFIDLANSIAGSTRGGPAKVAVISSCLFGTISGSATANVATTGSFTIPMMKRVGYKPHFAGAVEAVASTGGQIMPPIMGSTAFLLAEFVGIPYAEVALRAALPAILYFTAIFIMVDIEAVATELRPLSKSEIPKLSNILKQDYVLALPLLVITTALFVLRIGTTMAAIWSTGATLVACLIKYPSRFNIENVKEALTDGAIASLSITAICAVAGIIVGLVSFTGFGAKITTIIIGFAGGIKIPILILTMLVALLLGMGLPTAPAYVIAAAVCAPVLQEIGIPRFPAHLFIAYSALLAMITPPVALAAYTAASIANANPNTVGFAALRLGLTGLIVPYMFAYGPALVMYGSIITIIRSTVTAIIGVYLLSYSLQGYLLGKRVGLIIRIFLFIGALSLIETRFITDLIGISVAGGIGLMLLCKRIRKRKHHDF